MMRLSTMLKVDSTVGDDGSSPVAEQILERWSCDGGSVQFFRSSANFIYRLQDQDSMRYLRFADASEQRRDAARIVLPYLRRLCAWMSCGMLATSNFRPYFA